MDPTCTSRAPGAPRSPRRAPVAAGAVVAGLLLAACGGSASSAPAASSTTQAPPVTSTTTTTTTTASTPEAEVLAAVSGYWSVFFEANDPPDPEHPGFGRFYTGDALAKSVGNAASRRSMGQAVRPGSQDLFRSRPKVVSIEGDVATVEDCLVDDSTLVDVNSGAVLNDAVATSLMRIDLRQVDGVWRVA